MQEKEVMAAAAAVGAARVERKLLKIKVGELFHNYFSVFENKRHPEKHPHVDEREVYCTVG